MKSMSLAIVDDRLSDRLIIKGIVHDYNPDIEVIEFESGGPLCGYFGSEKTGSSNETDLNLIFLDLNIPGKDGIETIKEIRQLSSSQHIPIVVVTTSNSDQDLVNAYRAGANAYYVKPDDLDKMEKDFQVTLSYWLGVVKQI